MYWTRVHCIFRIQRYNQLFQRPTRDISQFILIGYVWFKNELMVPTLHFKKLMESATGLENKPYNDFGGTIILIRVLKKSCSHHKNGIPLIVNRLIQRSHSVRTCSILFLNSKSLYHDCPFFACSYNYPAMHEAVTN